MSKILITGNGFDLFHHLPTKYGHFMAIMMTIEEKSFSDNITFEELFGSFFKERFQNDYDSIKENYDTEKLSFERKKVIRVKELISKNNWYQYFKNVLELETWIDFETEIENILNQISILFEASRNDKTNKNLYKKTNLNINEDFSVFGLSINGQSIIFSFKQEFLDVRTKKINEKKSLKHLMKSLDEFSNIFSSYLLDITCEFYEIRKTELLLPLERISHFFTFNYTPTIENFYKIDKSKIVYLHGDIKNLVLGVSDIPSQIKENKFHHFTKYYQKIR